MSLLTKTFGLDMNPSREEGQYRNLAGNARNAATSYTRQLNPLLSRTSTDAARFRGESNSALDNYLTLLNRRRTDADRGNFVSQRVAPVDAQYRQGQTALANNLRARGISADSSAGVGGLAALEAMRGNAYAGAQMDATQQFDDERQSNLAEIYSLLYGRQQGAEADEYDILGQLQSLLAGEAGMYEGLYQGERGSREARQAQRQNLIGQLASLGASYFGGGIGGGAAGGGFSTPADATRARDLAMANNRAIGGGAASARNSRWGV